MQLSDFLNEREELGWYFSGLGPTVGLRACGLEAGGAVFDEAASNREHGRRHSPEHRAQVRRLEVVEAALGPIPSRTLRAAFSPFGAARASYRLLTAMSLDGVTLLGVALGCDPLVRLIGEVEDEDGIARPPGVVAQLMWLEHEVGGLKRGNRIPTSHRLYRVLEKSAEQTCESLHYYRIARAAAFAQQRARRDEERARDLEAYRRKMAGAA